MFKGRLGLWIGLIVIALLGQLTIEVAPSMFQSEELAITIDVKKDIDLTQVISNEKVNGFKFKAQDADAEVIITDNDTIAIEGYIKYEDYLYSPIVMYAGNVLDYDDGFIPVPNSTNKCHKVDLYNILIAMENGDEWENIGIDKHVANGPITLSIPNEQNPYYDEVIELFYLTLNKGLELDLATRTSLKDRVDALVNKCNKVSNINQAVAAEYDKSSKTHQVFIGPEYLYKRGPGMGLSYSSCFKPIYFFHTTYITADVYVKASTENETSSGLQFADKIQEKPNFMVCTGWRVVDSSFNLNDISSVYYKTP